MEKDILNFVVAKMEPIVECGMSLTAISKVLATPNSESVMCALNFLNEIIPFSDAQDLAAKLRTVKVECDKLLKTPKKFTCNTTTAILTRFNAPQDTEVQQFLLHNMSALKAVIDGIVPLLFEKTFELTVGENMFYHYNNRISIFLTGPVTSNVVTSPKTFHSQLGTVKVYDAVVCQRREIEKDVCFVHELSHYIRKIFDGVVAGNFLTLLPKLDFLPDKYITTSLEKTFSNDEEFRNITGILVQGGVLYFDWMTEAGYIIANNKCLRNSHNVSFIPRVPIGLIAKIKELSGKMSVLIADEVEYVESLNSW